MNRINTCLLVSLWLVALCAKGAEKNVQNKLEVSLIQECTKSQKDDFNSIVTNCKLQNESEICRNMLQLFRKNYPKIDCKAKTGILLIEENVRLDEQVLEKIEETHFGIKNKCGWLVTRDLNHLFNDHKDNAFHKHNCRMGKGTCGVRAAEFLEKHQGVDCSVDAPTSTKIDKDYILKLVKDTNSSTTEYCGVQFVEDLKALSVSTNDSLERFFMTYPHINCQVARTFNNGNSHPFPLVKTASEDTSTPLARIEAFKKLVGNLFDQSYPKIDERVFPFYKVNIKFDTKEIH